MESMLSRKSDWRYNTYLAKDLNAKLDANVLTNEQTDERTLGRMENRTPLWHWFDRCNKENNCQNSGIWFNDTFERNVIPSNKKHILFDKVG